MTLSIRARLTFWYSSIVVIVLVTAAVVGSFMQAQLSLQRLDAELARSMATLEGVMRTEFGEGLTLEAAAEEASIEVVVPDRMMALTRAEGGVLEVWGLPFDPAALPPMGMNKDATTLATPAGELRVLRREDEDEHESTAGSAGSHTTPMISAPA